MTREPESTIAQYIQSENGYLVDRGRPAVVQALRRMRIAQQGLWSRLPAAQRRAREELVARFLALAAERRSARGALRKLQSLLLVRIQALIERELHGEVIVGLAEEVEALRRVAETLGELERTDPVLIGESGRRLLTPGGVSPPMIDITPDDVDRLPDAAMSAIADVLARVARGGDNQAESSEE